MKNDNALIAYSNGPEYLELPESIRTTSGAEINPRLNLWSYRGESNSVYLNFDSIKGVSPELILALKFVLAYYAENKSESHLNNMFDRVGHLLKFLGEKNKEPITVITHVDLINYRASLDANNSWYLSSLAGFLKKWYDLGIPSLTAEARSLLVQLRLKGNNKGVAVLTMDPTQGPFTEFESQSISNALNNAYATGNVSLDMYLLCWLLMLLGQRNVQYAALKVCDVVVGKAKDDSLVYLIKMPRAKQRESAMRKEFKNRIIIPQIGKLLVQYASEVKLKYTDILPDPSQAPLFPQKTLNAATAPAGFAYHQTASSLGHSIKSVLSNLKASSERTGEPIHINSRRFRYTVGTRTAAEGHGVRIVAEVLDQSNTDNALVYVKIVPLMLERIDRAMAFVMAPMAQAFAGTLIRDESEAARNGDPRSRIVDPRFDTSFKPMGNCGSFSVCGFAAPIACYTCKNFQPWLEGPHDAVLDYLISERERLIENADARIAANNDFTILAVANLVMLCEQMRNEGNAGASHG